MTQKTSNMINTRAFAQHVNPMYITHIPDQGYCRVCGEKGGGRGYFNFNLFFIDQKTGV